MPCGGANQDGFSNDPVCAAERLLTISVDQKTASETQIEVDSLVSGCAFHGDSARAFVNDPVRSERLLSVSLASIAADPVRPERLAFLAHGESMAVDPVLSQGL